MTTLGARSTEGSTIDRVLHVALELADKQWKLASTTGLGQKPRLRTITARDVDALLEELARARRRFGLDETTRVVVCYEAGMDGFWVYRALTARGIETVVVDSSSIDVKRRQRQAKTDKLDATALVTKLVEYTRGHRKVWSVVRVPPEAAEDLRHTHRELDALKKDRTALVCELKGLVKTHGVRLEKLDRFPTRLATLRRPWDGALLPADLRARLERVWARIEMLNAHIAAVEARCAELMATSDTREGRLAQQLQVLKSVGPVLSWALVTEVFGWRTFQNRRQLGALLGLVPVANQSGDSHREHRITKAGNPQLRSLLIELAWMWVRHQPASPLTQWFQRRFAGGSKRVRRIGIVGVARRLVIELWKYVETGALPVGALTKDDARPVRRAA